MDDLIIGRCGKVATIRLNRPPHNFFDAELLRGIADALADADADSEVCVTLLSAEGRSFCAGADFTRSTGEQDRARIIYGEAARIFDRMKPLVAAVGGPAVGGGLGLALAADFRVVNAQARFHANFAALGLHPGFALTLTLPALIGRQRARDMLLSARRVMGEEAAAIGLADCFAATNPLDTEAMAFAQRMALNAPLALASIANAVPRIGGIEARAAMAEELAEQAQLFATEDFREGVRAAAEHRLANFRGC
ncbi:enoyl-CoA hydratase/isomerase family protein [Pseudoxanthomonas winnipegensis]|uniref:enoyl-CoA hydratase/isomerase family protein n=1 Tax=Pseudoxanthomonas winnipegensis TaxID=2480810 RepID=UPI0030F43497